MLYGNNQIVVIKLNKKTYNVKTDSKGYAKLSIPNTVKPGNYALTATYAGQTIKHTVKVKQSLKLSKVKVKKSAKKLVIKATLKGKKPIKGKKVTLKIKGKKIKAVVELVENGVIYGNLTVSQLCKVERVVLRSWYELKEWIENFKYPFKPNEYLAWYTREQLLKVWQNKALVQKRIKPDGRHQNFEFTSTEVNSYCAYMLYFGKEDSFTKGNSTSYVPIIALKVS